MGKEQAGFLERHTLAGDCPNWLRNFNACACNEMDLRNALSTAQSRLEEMEKALEAIPCLKLDILADWLDMKFPNDPDEVQQDLRKIARSVRQALTSQQREGENPK